MTSAYKYKKYNRILVISILVLIVIAISSVFFGKYAITSKEVVGLIFKNNSLEDLDVKKHILLEIRIPRIILSTLVGTSLALAGTVLQGVLMNPLASPDVLGTSSASGFGAALGILFFPDKLILIAMTSFLLGLISLVLIYALCRAKKDFSVLSIILSGIIVSSIFISLTAMIKFVADTENTLPAITFWLMGSFAGASLMQIKILALPLLLGGIITYLLRWKINLLSLGDEEAMLSGVNPTKLKAVLLLVSTVLIATTVTVAGIVGWVGLVIPHIVRKLIGENHGYVIPICAVFGAVFMIICDNLARNIGFSEIPIGIITALIGAPIFTIIFIFSRGVNR